MTDELVSDEEFLRRVGRRVGRERRRRGWRQEDLSERVGMSRSRLARVEAGKAKKLPLTELRRVAEALGVGLGYLVTRDDHPVHGLLRLPAPAMEQRELLELASAGVVSRLLHADPEETARLHDVVEALLHCPGDSLSRQVMALWLANGGTRSDDK